MKSKNKTTAKKTKLTDSQLRRAVKEKFGVIDARIISPSDVETAAWVRLKCQYGCDGYGQSLVCPPYTPTPEQMRRILDCYKRAVLIHFSPDAEIKSTVVELETEFFLKGAWKAFGLGAGPCPFCRSCDIEKKECRYAERARPAMEACGIDVFSTVKKAGFPIEVVRTKRQCPNFYGLILID